MFAGHCMLLYVQTLKCLWEMCVALNKSQPNPIRNNTLPPFATQSLTTAFVSAVTLTG